MPGEGTRRSRRGGVYGGWRSSRLRALRIVRDIRLSRAGDAEGVGGDVFGDHATRSRVGAIADFHGRDEHRVHGSLHIRPDSRAMFSAAVVVGGDVARADIRLL